MSKEQSDKVILTPTQYKFLNTFEGFKKKGSHEYFVLIHIISQIGRQLVYIITGYGVQLSENDIKELLNGLTQEKFAELCIEAIVNGYKVKDTYIIVNKQSYYVHDYFPDGTFIVKYDNGQNVHNPKIFQSKEYAEEIAKSIGWEVILYEG